jgi:hypothetical protein
MTEITYLEEPYELIDKPLGFHLMGLQETASGYGAKLTSRRVVRFPNGSERRVYITCYSNVGSAWIHLNGRRVYLRD